MGLTQITTGGVDDNINIDSNTLKVDGTNNRVGIGTSSPSVKLEVSGAIIADGNISATSGGATRTITLGPAGAGLEYNVDGTTFLGGRTDAYPLVFRTNSSERLRIDSSGRCGIGTSSADEALHVYSSSGAIKIDSSGDAALRFATSGTNKFSIFQSGGTLRFFDNTNNAERLRIDSSGKVGVGLTPASATLEVSGQHIYTSSASSLATAATKAAFRVKGSTNSSDSLWMGVETTNAEPYIQGANGVGTASKDLLLNPFGGHVGINTTSPDQTLTVNGGVGINNTGSGGGSPILTITNNSGNPFINCTNNSTALTFGYNSSERMRIDSSGRVGVGTSAPYNVLTGKSLSIGNGVGAAEVNFLSATDAFGSIYFGDGTSGNATTRGSLEYVHTDDSMRFGVAASERMRIDSSGNVGIGCDNPQYQIDLSASSLDHLFTGAINAEQDGGDYALKLTALGKSGGRTGSVRFITGQNTSSGSERMRITYGGKILCGSTSALSFTSTNGLEVHSSNNGGALILRNTAATSGRYWRIGPETNNTLVLYDHNGGGQYMSSGGTSWNSNASDLRVKDVVGDLNQTTSWNVLKGLQIKQWWFKNENTEHRSENTPHVGPIAQELHALDPNLRLESPSGTTAATFGQNFDGPVYTYDNDLLLKHALSALNQAITKIETLEAKVAALESAE